MAFVVTSHRKPIGYWEPERLDQHFYYAWGVFVPETAFDHLRPVFEKAPHGLPLYDLLEQEIIA